MLTDKEKNDIAKILIQKINIFECPMCHSHKFTIVDGYVTQTLQSNMKGFSLGGVLLPSIVIVCNKCGFMSYHNMGVLGLLNKDKKDITLSDFDIEHLKTWTNGSGTFRRVDYSKNEIGFYLSGKYFSAENAKEIAQWNNFFEKLKNCQFIEIVDYNKSNEPIYRLTQRAYDYVKNLDK